MNHSFILEASRKAFKAEIEKQIKFGYKLVPGSMYVKSIESGTPIQNKDSDLNDVVEFYSIALENEYGTSNVSIEEDPDAFYNTITELLTKGYTIVIGSTYINSVRKNGYVDLVRYQQTWHSCTMFKD